MKAVLVYSFIAILLCYSGVSHAQQWKILLDKADRLKLDKEFEEASEYYRKAKPAIPKDSLGSITHIVLLRSFAESCYSSNQSEEAFEICNELKQVLNKSYGEIHADFAWACNLQGAILNINGDWDSAKSMHFQAMTIREKLFSDQHPAYAQSCNNLGALYHDMGIYDSAEILLLRAKAIRENIKPIKRSDFYAISCTGLANLYRDMGQYEKAEALYLEAKDIRGKDSTNKPKYAASCNILADLYNYMGLEEKAEALYLEAKEIRYQQDPASYEYGQSCNNLSALYRDMGKYERATSLALEAKKIYEKTLPEGHASRTINLNNLGELYAAMGKYKEAAQCFQKARAIWKKTLDKDHPYLIANAEGLARVHWNLKETTKAAALYKEAANSRYNRLNSVFAFTSENEKHQYLENISGSADEYLSFYYRMMPHGKAGNIYTLSLLNRNLILSSVQQTRNHINSSGDAGLIQTYTNWTNTKQQLAKLYARPADAKPGLVAQLEARSDSLEKILSRQSSIFKDQQSAPSWQGLQQQLSSKDCAIEFVQFQLFNGKVWTDSILYVAMVLKKDMVEPVWITLFEKKKLDSILSNQGRDEQETLSRYYNSPDLYNCIWKPLEKHLSGISSIYLALAGDLFRIAFDALPSQGTELLGDKYRLLRLNSTAAIAGALRESNVALSTIRLYGGIQYDADTSSLRNQVHVKSGNSEPLLLPESLTRGKSFRYLPGTAVEVTGIRQLADEKGIASKVLSGIEATEESFQELNGDRSPSLLHIATHGFFFPDPATDKRDSIQVKFETSGSAFRQAENPLLRAGLLFAGANNTWKGLPMPGIEDGILTAYEAGNLYLPNTRMVVLSACETALGDIRGSEGVYGLQRAFRMAGVQNLVMSLWKVPDAETSEFMQAFYRNLFNSMDVTGAFYEAQADMKTKYRGEPYKWAAWMLIR